jgi:hypothetical protein
MIVTKAYQVRRKSFVFRTIPSLAVLVLLLAFGLVQSTLAQSPTPIPLALNNNYMVTGDYVVGGWNKVGNPSTVSGTLMSTGTINIPDAIAYPANMAQQVPAGADIVAAFLYWQSVENSGTYAGQNGLFRGYPFAGAILGNPNAPVSWSSGGCAGSSQGSKTIVTYRADVTALMPLDSNGNVVPNTSYQVNLPDTGKTSQAPFALGATLVIVYRVLAPDVPLRAVVIYDGSYAPSNTAQITSVPMIGFYQAGADQQSIPSKITHIVGNGQSNKLEQVYLNNYDANGNLVHSTVLPSIYGTNPPFPGKYNTTWDNPTWFPNTYPTTSYTGSAASAIMPNEFAESAVVVPSSSNKGCVSWGAVVMSTTVQDSDRDGLLDVWEQNDGYCDAGANRGLTTQGSCPLQATDPSWVSLPAANPGSQDIFVQLDYMCGANADGTANCDSTNGGISFAPNANVVPSLITAYANRGITLHVNPADSHIITQQVCTDNTSVSPPQYCPFPGPAGVGVVGWKAGFEFLKNQPLNYPDEASCVAAGPLCVRRFQPGRRNSYHEVIFANSSASPNWGFLDGSLQTVAVAKGGVLTFTTPSPSGLTVDSAAPNGRVTISDAISNPALNGTYLVQSVTTVSPYTFTVVNANVTAAPTQTTDPLLSVTSGVVGSASGVSDVGGSDSMISLGLWGADGRTDAVQSGTVMHELGHSIGLTHGGLYRTGPTFPTNNPIGSYGFTFEPNCKSNFQSVMNYQFQVDLLDGSLDYSATALPTINESVASSSGFVSPLSTKWYSPNKPLVGSPASSHCDGTPRLPAEIMYPVQGSASSMTWSAGQDTNFDGKIEKNLDGFNDWGNIDLRQMGATANDFWASGKNAIGGGKNAIGGGKNAIGGGKNAIGGGKNAIGGGVGEITVTAASSVVRTPSNVTDQLTAQNTITVYWVPPSFGQSQIAAFNVYRSVNGAAFTAQPYATVPVTGTPLPTQYADTIVSCASYAYFVTTVLNDGRESAPSNTTAPAISVPCQFVGFLSPLNTAGTISAPSFSGTEKQGSAVPTKWELLDASGNPISDLSTLKLMQACPTTSSTAPPSSTSCVLLYSPTSGAKGKSTFRFSSPQFIFNWDTSSTIGSVAGYFTLEVTINDGSAVKATTVQFQ